MLLIGLIGQVVCSMFLSMCKLYRTAFIIRLVSGSFSGNSPVIKSVISEVSIESNIPILYSYFTIGLGISWILGPALASLSNIAYSNESGVLMEFLSANPYFIPFFLQ